MQSRTDLEANDGPAILQQAVGVAIDGVDQVVAGRGGVGVPGSSAGGQQVEVVAVQVERVLLLPSPAGPGRATPADSSSL